jgi:hypothetical protein
MRRNPASSATFTPNKKISILLMPYPALSKKKVASAFLPSSSCRETKKTGKAFLICRVTAGEQFRNRLKNYHDESANCIVSGLSKNGYLPGHL